MLNPAPVAPVDEFQSDDAISAHVLSYLYQLRSITVIRHLFPLIVACQKHRGAKLALLEGDSFFESKETELQHEIDKRLLALSILTVEMKVMAASSDFSSLTHEWDTVKIWSDGPSLENYNLHSHFIEKQMKLVWQIAENSSCFSSDTENDHLLIRFILHETPELIEHIARIRGLATYVAAVGDIDDEMKNKLDYMLTVLNQKKEKFRVLSRQLQQYVLRDVPALIELQIQDVRIIQFVQLVKKSIIDTSTINKDDHSIFSLASNIIDSQTEIVKQGLDYIQRRVHQQFDCWHYSIDE